MKFKNTNIDEHGVDLAVRDFGPNGMVSYFPTRKTAHQRLRGTRKCMVNGCDERDSQRGLCPAHYNVAYWLVRRRETTWEMLIAKGRCLKSERVNDSPAKAFFLA